MRIHPLSVSEVGKGTLLVDNPHSSFLRPDLDTLDVTGGLSESLEFIVEGVGDFYGRLGVELGREGDLEENILHNVRSVGTLELEWFALEENIVEAPSLGRQDRGHACLSLFDEERDVHGTGASVTGSPRLSGHGVGSMTVGTQGLTISPRLGDGVNNLVAIEA